MIPCKIFQSVSSIRILSNYAVQDAWHINGSDHESAHSSTSIEIEPVKPRDRRYFSVVDLKTRGEDPLPGIPLDLSTLKTEEEKYGFEAKHVKIGFKIAAGKGISGISLLALVIRLN